MLFLILLLSAIGFEVGTVELTMWLLFLVIGQHEHARSTRLGGHRRSPIGRPAAVAEVQPGRGRRPVVAVPVGGAFGRREQAVLLVEPQRLGGGPGCRDQLADAHGVAPLRLTFHCTGRFMMSPVESAHAGLRDAPRELSTFGGE